MPRLAHRDDLAELLQRISSPNSSASEQPWPLLSSQFLEISQNPTVTVSHSRRLSPVSERATDPCQLLYQVQDYPEMLKVISRAMVAQPSA